MKTLNYHNPIIQTDLQEIVSENYNWGKLKNKTILVTGANGMLATYFVYVLFYLNEKFDYQIKILALVRNLKKAELLFSAMKNNEIFTFLHQDVAAPIAYDGKIDYILHAAGSADPVSIINNPVGMVRANTIGTFSVCETAKKSKTQKILFTSTREVYGKLENIDVNDETHFGEIDPLDQRSCYPESKRMAETILKSYQTQDRIDFNAVRIAHSYGPGMKIENDGRVMADLISDIVHGRNIVLKSTGEAVRAFCYITDAVKAMFLVLFEGTSGEAYNIANETEPITIKNLSELLVSLQPEKKLKIKYKILENQQGYTNYKRTALNTDKLGKLGWQPMVLLKAGLLRTINSFVE
jgi:nucleoside-diphosphate-sugar epimerase